MFMASVPDDFSPPAPESAYDEELLAQIDDIGWFNLHIAEEAGSPLFSFSLGHFHKHNHPEIIVVGLSSDTAHELLNIAGINIVTSDEKLKLYHKYTDFTEGLSVAFIPVDLDKYAEYLGYANWYYDSLPMPYPALQMVWPDRDGVYPWESGYDERFSQLQPILGEAPKAAR